MNKRQVMVVRTAIAVAVLMLLFPPFVVSFGGGSQRNAGYGFLLSAPQNGIAIVNVALLFAQWFLLAAVGWTLFRLNAKWQPTADAVPWQRKTLTAARDAWVNSRFWRIVGLGLFFFDVLITLGRENGADIAQPLSRAFLWLIVATANYFYHFFRALFLGDEKGHAQQKNALKFSIKRVCLALTIIGMVGLALYFLPSQNGHFVFGDSDQEQR